MPSMTVPEAPALHRNQFTARVAANLPLCGEHFRLVLQLNAFPATEPGQFIQIACRDMSANYSPETEIDWQPGMQFDLEGRELMSPLAMLRRPFSLAGRRDTPNGVELDIIHRVVGVGTDWLARLTTADAVDIIGPLGNRFTLPPRGGRAMLVGGGVGIPPMLYLAEKLAFRDPPAIAFTGALSRDLLPVTLVAGARPNGADNDEPLGDVLDFDIHGVRSVVTTDDGSYGFRGYVTQALERYIQRTTHERQNEPPAVIYTCGPEPMMKRVADIAAAFGIECQIAVERAMACGLGTCQSCCIKLKRDPTRDGQAFAGKNWIYKLACTDGPVFKCSDLLW
jgi:dihydroorotate dehydrogenase electron transfer subunit